MNKLVWKEVKDIFTPGGDPCYCCPACGKGRHVYGIECLENRREECPDCGAKLEYPWEAEK